MEKKDTTNICITIDADLNHKFRHVILEKYGTERGSLQKSAEEAIKLFVNQHNKSSESMDKIPTMENTVSSNSNEISKKRRIIKDS